MSPQNSSSLCFDTVIVGGGIMGSSIAYFLSSNTDYRGSIVVIEKDPLYTNCSTTRSCGSFRQQFSLPENIRLSQESFKFFLEAGDLLQTESSKPDIGLKHSYYLILATAEGQKTLKENFDLQIQQGSQVQFLESDSLSKAYPWLNVDGIAVGCKGLYGEGWLDPYSLLMAFRKKAISQGVQYLEDEAISTKRTGDRIASVCLANYGEVSCGAIVNATGPYAGRFANLSDISLPVTAKKRNVFVFESPAEIEEMPLVVDPANFYVRPEGKAYVCGYSPMADEPDPTDFSLDVIHTVFDEKIWPQLAFRIPEFENLRIVNYWAGHYDFNTLDQNGIVGVHPEIKNYHFINGFSGHGLQQSPALGRAISELITYGEYKTLDLKRMGYNRIARQQPFEENAII